MPKRFSEYTLQDHLRLRPLTQGLKTMKYRAADRRYLALAPAFGDIDALRKAIAGKNVVLTIAFEDPAGLDMHAALIKKYVLHDYHVVADNSRDASSILRNRDIAASHGALYLHLPPNPWTEKKDSRSHGIALNWLWHNLLRPGRPKAFGFVDHDLFPVAPVDPFAPLSAHPFYGDLRTADSRWFLWAGYCFFRFDAVAGKPLDFGLDWFLGLDTGGANWDVLYRHADPTVLPPRPVEAFAALPDHPLEQAYFERRVEWIHEVGWPRDPAIRNAKRIALTKLLAPYLDKSGSVAVSAPT